MVRLPRAFYYLSLLLLCFACKKKIECDNAQLCVINIGSDTIYYAWGSSFYTDTLPPAQKACIYVGPITINSRTESVEWVDFDSNHGDYRIKVDDCYVEKGIE